MRWPERVYRVLLRCYPAEFRDEYASEMTQAFRDRLRDDRAPGMWLGLVTDLALSAPKEQYHVLLNDLRYAVRMMRKAPAFTAAVVLTVALGIAANTAIFSVVNTVLLRPLPYASPDRLLQLAEKNDTLHLPRFGASVLNYLSWREQVRTFQQLGAIGFANFNLSGNGEPEQFIGGRLSPSVLPILGITPLAGRGFREGEDAPGAAPVAMISDGLWKRRFGSDPAILGRNITLNGADYTVVGIAPPALVLFTTGDIWTPLTIDPSQERRLNHVIIVIGRLQPGVSIAQAQAEANAVAVRVAQHYPEDRDWGIALVTFDELFVNDQLRTGLLVLLCAVVFVLLIVCANIANLLLARAASRQKEIAVRTAMGASRGRLLRQLLAESLLLSAIGGGAGLVGAVWAVRAMNRALPPNLLPLPDVSIDATVLAFAVAATVATGLLCGVAPAWHAARADLNAMLKQTSRSSTSGARRLRNGLAAAELALATLLLIGAGLLVQSLMHLQRAHLGFEPGGLLTFQVAPPPAKYPVDDRGPLFYQRLVASLRVLPGVRSAAVSSGIPLGAGNYTRSPVTTTGPSVLPPDTPVVIDWRIVSPGFFRTLGIPLLRGRDFTDADGPKAQAALIVSQATARRFWGAGDPLGRVLRRVNDGKALTIVGVVGDVRSTALNDETPTLYYPGAVRVAQLMDVVVRTAGAPEELLSAVRQKVHELDAELPLANVRTMDECVAGSAAQPRVNALLLAAFAGVALLIAAIGIYGVLAYSVTQRTREIGLRMALGAPRSRVVRLIVREGMTVAAAGIGAGLLGAVALSQTIASLVFAAPVRDPLTFGAVALVLTLVALAACSVPARRASRVDPMIALREE